MDNGKGVRMDDLAAIQMILQTSPEPSLFNTHIPNIYEFGGTDKEDFTIFLLEIELFFIGLAVPDATRYTILRMMLKGDAKDFLERWEEEQQQNTCRKGSHHHHLSSTCNAFTERHHYQAAISALEEKYVKPSALGYYEWLKKQLHQHSICMNWRKNGYNTQNATTIKQPVTLWLVICGWLCHQASPTTVICNQHIVHELSPLFRFFNVVLSVYKTIYIKRVGWQQGQVTFMIMGKCVRYPYKWLISVICRFYHALS